MANVGAVNIRLGATTQDFISAMKGASANVLSLATNLNSNLAAAYSAADRKQKVFDRGLGRMGSNMQNLGKGLSTFVTAPLVGLGAAAFKTYADINALQLGLQNITGSASAAKLRFDELKQVARLPGLGLEEAVQGDVRLQAVGFSALTSKQALLQFGNALALTGGGKVQLDSVITQLSQMGSKSKVLAEDLKPILTASPAVATAVRKLMGTIDSEAISKKLTAAGKGPANFIQDLITELSKLERVQGGPKNAIENFGDSVKLAGFSLGEAADRAFNVTGAINGLGDTIGNAAEGFAKASPATQQFALAATGAAVAIGPLTAGLGAAVKLLPLVQTGAAALVAPFTLATAAAAALGLGAVSIYSFTRAVKSAYDESKILANVNTQVSAGIADQTSKLGGLLEVAYNDNASKKDRIAAIKELNQLSPKYLGDLTLETLNTNQAAQAIQKYVEVLQLKAQAIAYQNGLVESQATLARLQSEGLKGQVSFLDKLGASLLNAGGAAGAASDLVAKAIERQTTALADAKKTADFYTQGLANVNKELGKRGESAAARPDSGLMNGVQAEPGKEKKVDTWAERTRKDLAAVDGLIKEFEAKNPGVEVPFFLKLQKGYYQDNLQIEKKAILDDVQEMKTTLTKELEALGPDLQKLAQSSWGKYFEIGANGVKKMIVPINQLQQTIEDNARKLANLPAGQKGFSAVDANEKGQNVLDQLKQDVKMTAQSSSLGAAVAGIFDTDAMQAAFDKGQISLSQLESLAANMRTAIDGFTNGLKAIGGEALTGIFEAVGGTLGGNTKAFSNFGKGILNMIADLAVRIGKAMLLLAAPMLFSGILSAEGVRNLAVGGALTVAGSAIKALSAKEAPGFAKGGMFYGENTIRVGEYGSASFNPEVVSPLKSLSSIIQPIIKSSVMDGVRNMASMRGLPGMQPLQYPQVQTQNIRVANRTMQPIQVEVSGRLSGSDLYLSNAREARNRREFG
jgi:tape measure domain-containing protein